MAARGLTEGERRLVRSLFGDAIDCDKVWIVHRRWWPFQPREVAMAPTGNIHIPPRSSLWSDDFAGASLGLQGLFVHEMTHVLQSQQRGRFYLPLMRHPFCRYRYRIEAGRPFDRYGVEQQAEIMRHIFLASRGVEVADAAGLAALQRQLPFRAA